MDVFVFYITLFVLDELKEFVKNLSPLKSVRKAIQLSTKKQFVIKCVNIESSQRKEMSDIEKLVLTRLKGSSPYIVNLVECFDLVYEIRNLFILYLSRTNIDISYWNFVIEIWTLLFFSVIIHLLMSLFVIVISFNILFYFRKYGIFFLNYCLHLELWKVLILFIRISVDYLYTFEMMVW
jgi:hypothetical protein